jgi:glycine C-acetyltransferase
MSDLFDKCHGDGGYFGRYRAAGDNYVVQPILDSLPGPHMESGGRRVIMWGINSYLGLTGNQRIKAAALASVQRYSTSSPMGSRLLTGNTSKHEALERRLASYCGKPAALLFNYGYLGVMGTISALIGPKDEVIIDKLSHASMIDGTILAMAGRRFRPFRHNDMDSLEQQLRAARQRNEGGILIVVEGVYGMRGDLANLPAIAALARRYEARIFIDDAHGFGVMGDSGRGTAEHFGVQDEIDLYFGTFAKAFAAIGGVTAGDPEVIEYIRFNARTNVFAKALPMVYVDVLDATLDEILAHPEYRARMWRNARSLQRGLVELGYSIGDTRSPITPVYIPSGQETARAIMVMLREDYGVFLSGVTYPVVPRGINLFRMIPTALHSDEDIATTLTAFAEIRERLGLDLGSLDQLATA